MELYNYKAKLIKVVDGDTVKVNIDLGFNINWETNARLAGIDADELNAKDPLLKESAQNAKKYLESALKVGDRIHIISKELDKYKRPVIVIINKDGTNLNEELLNKGLVKKYS